MRAIGVMQPYLFPYLGYFHLLHAVDRLVILDDVTWINRGWINRNRVLTGRSPVTFTVPVRGASQNRRIDEVERADTQRWRVKLRRTLQEAYGHAPFYRRTAELVDAVLNDPERHLATWLVRSLQLTCDLIGLRHDFTRASIDHAGVSRGRTERIVDICRRESATTYVNLSGGRPFYQAADFSAQGIELRFTRSSFPSYRQGQHPFVPGLSIIDALMYCTREQLSVQVSAYSLERPND